MGANKTLKMRKITLLFFGLVFSGVGYAQTAQSDLSIGIAFKNIPFQDNRLPAFMLESHYYVTNRWATGGNLAYTRQKFGHAFGLDARRTYLYLFSVNWANRWEVVQTKKLSVHANLDAGIIVATLRDRENYEWVDSGYYYEDWYYVENQSKVYNKLNRDTYFSVQPSLGLSYKLFELSPKDKLGLHFTANIGYQLAAGGGDFSTSNDFQNPSWFVGLKIIGPTKE